jgi:hypothetical protein
MPKEEHTVSIVPPENRYQLNYSAYFSKAGQATATDFGAGPGFEVQKEEVPAYELDPAQNVVSGHAAEALLASLAGERSREASAHLRLRQTLLTDHPRICALGSEQLPAGNSKETHLFLVSLLLHSTETCP